MDTHAGACLIEKHLTMSHAGACLIEKHLTMSREVDGPDSKVDAHPASVAAAPISACSSFTDDQQCSRHSFVLVQFSTEPAEFKQMVEDVRVMEKASPLPPQCV